MEVRVSATRLLVLGVVRMHGTAHGYQVRRELLTWSADRWGNVAPGSIYHALKQMAKEGLLDQVDIEPGGSGPDAASEYNFAAALTFLTALPRKRAISLLRHRMTQLTGRRANLANLLEEGAGWGQPAHISEMYRLWRVGADATIEGAEGLVKRLEAGEYVMAAEA